VSIGEYSMGEAAVSEQPTTSTSKKAPPKRQTAAKSDATVTPEPR